MNVACLDLCLKLFVLSPQDVPVSIPRRPQGRQGHEGKFIVFGFMK